MILAPSPLKRIVFFLVSDTLISLFTLYFAYNLRFNFQVPLNFMDNFVFVFIILFSLKVSVFFYFRLYRTAWRFFSLYEIKKILLAHIVVYLLFSLVYFLFQENIPLARSIIIIDFMLSLVFISFLRLLKRIILESSKNNKYKNTLIIGANSSINSLLHDKKNLEYTPVAIIDSSDLLIGTYILNLKVYSFEDLKKVVKSKSIESVIISKEYSQKRLVEIYDTLSELEITDIKVINTLSSTEKKELKDIGVEDLLARHPQDLDKKKIENFI